MEMTELAREHIAVTHGIFRASSAVLHPIVMLSPAYPGEPPLPAAGRVAAVPLHGVQYFWQQRMVSWLRSNTSNKQTNNIIHNESAL
jgi:hypothetical protein